MILNEQVFSQAMLLAGELEDQQEALLKTLCGAATVSLSARLRDGIAQEDCRADFIAAASLYALAALNEAGGADRAARSGGSAASNCLRYQAQMIIGPDLKDQFAFLEV